MKSKYYDSNGHTLAGVKEYIELKKQTDELINPHLLEEIIKQFEYDYNMNNINSEKLSKSFPNRTTTIHIKNGTIEKLQEMNKEALNIIKNL